MDRLPKRRRTGFRPSHTETFFVQDSEDEEYDSDVVLTSERSWIGAGKGKAPMKEQEDEEEEEEMSIRRRKCKGRVLESDEDDDEIFCGFDIVERKAGAMGGSVTVQATSNGYRVGTPIKFSKGEIKSSLQKAVRRQDCELADKALTLYSALIGADPEKRDITWIRNRIVIIAVEDTSHNLSGITHALQLWERGAKMSWTALVRDIRYVLFFLCTHGTSRIHSWMRAYFNKNPVVVPMPRNIDTIIEATTAHMDEDSGASFVEGIRTNPDASLFRDELLRLSQELPSKRREFVKLFHKFVKSRQLVDTKKGIHNNDSDMLHRALVYYMTHGVDTDDVLSCPPPPRCDTIVSPLPEFATDDIHVKHGAKGTKKGLLRFAEVGSLIVDPVVSPGQLKYAHAYFFDKGLRGAVMDAAMGTLELEHSDDDDDDDDDDGAGAAGGGIGEHQVLVLHKNALDDDNKNLGMVGGLKAPTFVLNDSMFVKLYESDKHEDAMYAIHCFDSLQQAGLSSHRAVLHDAVATPGFFEALAISTPDKDQRDKQIRSWNKRFQKCLAIVTDVIHDPVKSTRWLKDNPSASYVPELARVLLHRRLVQTSDNNGSNIVIEPSTGRMFSIDFNFSPKSNVSFLQSGFPEKILDQVRMYIASYRKELNEFVKSIQVQPYSFIDKDFAL